MSEDNIFSAGDEGDDESFGERFERGAQLQLEIFKRTFSLIAENFSTLLPAIGPLVVLTLVSIAFGMAIGVWQAYDESVVLLATSINYAVSFCVGLISLFLQLGFIRMLLALDRGQEADSSMMLEQGAKFPKALGASVVVSIVVFMGTLACLLPGFYIYFGLMFVVAMVVDTDLSFGDLFGASWELTTGYRWFLLFQSLLIAVGAFVFYCVTCGLGVVFASILAIAVQAVTYNAILQAKEAQ